MREDLRKKHKNFDVFPSTPQTALAIWLLGMEITEWLIAKLYELGMLFLMFTSMESEATGEGNWVLFKFQL